MNAKNLLAAASIATLGLAILAGAMAVADPPKEFKLPPGWTEADFKAFVEAATPGAMHERLSQDVGEWEGKNTMWMGPGAEPIQSECTSTVTSLLGGRFTKCEMAGEMPGMGPYRGLAIHGYDNVSKTFVATWIDNMSTGFANGEGELSADGKTITWTFTGNCPVAKKPVTMRQVETVTGPGKKTLEMFGPEPKTGKEFKMMRIELTKKE
jgi:hypothetical protein